MAKKYKKRIKPPPLKYKVLHLSKTPICGSAGILSDAINQYSDTWQSKVYVTTTKVSDKDYAIDYQNAISREDLPTAIKEADLIHFHNSAPENWNIEYKLFLIQLHSDPSSMTEILKVHRNSCITLSQKHATLKEYAGLRHIPNIIPIYKDLYMPKSKPKSKTKRFGINIVYTPTNKYQADDYTDTVNGKGYSETVAILKALKTEFKDAIKVSILEKLSKEKVLEIRQTADIVIDECSTRGYHYSSLEGLSTGCVTIAHLNLDVMAIISEITDSPICALPWINTSISNLYQTLVSLITMDKQILETFKKYSREWMERYWNPENLIKKITGIYHQELGGNYGESLAEKSKYFLKNQVEI